MNNRPSLEVALDSLWMSLHHFSKLVKGEANTACLEWGGHERSMDAVKPCPAGRRFEGADQARWLGDKEVIWWMLFIFSDGSVLIYFCVLIWRQHLVLRAYSSEWEVFFFFPVLQGQPSHSSASRYPCCLSLRICCLPCFKFRHLQLSLPLWFHVFYFSLPVVSWAKNWVIRAILIQLSSGVAASRRAPGEGIPVKAPADFSSDYLIVSGPSKPLFYPVLCFVLTCFCLFLSNSVKRKTFHSKEM